MKKNICVVEIKENLAKIKEQISNIKVKIIAVTKYATSRQIFEAYNLGIKDFGESYLQDALKKITNDENLKSINDDINWHFIGRLQKNKVKNVVGCFSLIHSVDSLELAELINKVSFSKNLLQEILLQINISGEETKGGFSRETLITLFPKLIILPNIKIKGLMTIAAKTNDKETIRNCFMELANLKCELNKKHNSDLTELSMGMTSDYTIALECGTTMLRLGRAIFDNT